VGVVAVPDERLDKLADLSKSAKKIPAVVEFYDIAGLVRGAYKGEGLGNQFLSHIREVNAIVEVLRCFKGSEIIHVENSVDPVRDMEIINTELALKDLETVEKILKKAEGEAKTGKKEAQKDLEALMAARKILTEGQLLGQQKHSNILQNVRIKELNLLTAKRQIYLLNGKAEDVPHELREKIAELGADFVITDLSAIQNLEELIVHAYKVLNLISFFTTGEDETRAWTIERGTRAPQAAGVIHTDFEKKFIRAEVIGWKKLIEAGGWNEARNKGLMRTEGKDYVVQDGDVMVIRHS